MKEGYCMQILNKNQCLTIDDLISLWNEKEQNIQRVELTNLVLDLHLGKAITNIGQFDLDFDVLNSVRNLCQIWGSGLDELPLDKREEIYNFLLQKRLQTEVTIKAVIEQNTLKGVFSKRYTYQPINKLLANFKNIVVIDKDLKGKIISYNANIKNFYFLYMIDNKVQEIQKKYGLPHVIPAVFFRTSENGSYQTQLMPCVLYSVTKTIFIYPEMIRVKHIGKNDISHVTALMENIYVLLDEPFNKIKKQQSITINSDKLYSILEDIYDYLKIGKRKAKKINEYVGDYINQRSYVINNLFDITSLVCNYLMKTSNDLETKIMAGKVLNIDERVIEI